MEPLHNIDVLELMEESGANARDYQLTSAIPRGIYIENGDLPFEWLLETDPEKPRAGRSRAPYDRGLRFNFDKGYMITTDFPRSIPRRDRLEEKDVAFQVEMSIFHRWESEDSQSFRENNGLAYIEGEGGIIFSYDEFPGVVMIDMPASRLPMDSQSLYSCFPELLEFRGLKDTRVHLMIGGFPTALEITSMLTEDNSEISFEGLVLSTLNSRDREEQEIHSFADYNRLRCRRNWEGERQYSDFSLQPEFNGYGFSLPTHLNNLRDLGLSLDSYRLDITLEPGEETFVMPREPLGSNDSIVLVVNLGSEQRGVRNGDVYGFSIDHWSWQRHFNQFSLNGEIQVGGDAERTLWILPAPSISFYGTQVRESNLHPIVDRHIFILGGYALLELVVGPEKNEVVSIHLRRNYDGRDWSEFLEVLESGISQSLLEDVGYGALYRDGGLGYFQNGEIPKRILEYVVPEHLDDESDDIIYSVRGDLYTFPTPVQAFLDNGWELSRSPNVTESQSGEVTFSRDGIEFSAYVENLEDKLIPIEYYHIVRVHQEWRPDNSLEGEEIAVINVSLRDLWLCTDNYFELFPGEFRQFRPYDINFNIESENIKLVLDSLWERTGWYYGFQKGDTIIRVHYCYSSPYEFEEDILVFKVWSVELIYDHGSRFGSLVGNYDSETGVNAEDILEDMLRILESF
jgi:hypothetical protein